MGADQIKNLLGGGNTQSGVGAGLTAEQAGGPGAGEMSTAGGGMTSGATPGAAADLGAQFTGSGVPGGQGIGLRQLAGMAPSVDTSLKVAQLAAGLMPHGGAAGSAGGGGIGRSGPTAAPQFSTEGPRKPRETLSPYARLTQALRKEL